MKIISLLLISFIAIFSVNSKAGVFIGMATPVYSIGGALEHSRKVGQIIFIGGEAIALSLIVGGSFIVAGSGVFSVAGGILLIALDEKDNGLDSYELAVAKKFPFINDMTAVSELAQVLYNKVSEQNENLGMRQINIEENIVVEILERSDLSHQQIQLVISEIQ